MNGSLARLAVVVNDFGREILAGAALAGQQHRRGRARGDLLQQRLDAAIAALVADDAVEAVGLRLVGAQRPHLPPKPRRFERLFDEQRNLVEVERLVGVVIRAMLHRLDRRLHAE